MSGVAEVVSIGVARPPAGKIPPTPRFSLLLFPIAEDELWLLENNNADSHPPYSYNREQFRYLVRGFSTFLLCVLLSKPLINPLYSVKCSSFSLAKKSFNNFINERDLML